MVRTLNVTMDDEEFEDLLKTKEETPWPLFLKELLAAYKGMKSSTRKASK